MIDVSNLLRNAGRFISNNSPAILTTLAVVGSVGTTVLAVQATRDAVRILDQIGEEPADRYKRVEERVKLVWKFYIPVVLSAAGTVACIVGANSISNKRTTAMITAYSISETALREYQGKVRETIGAAKDQKIIDELAQEEVTKNPPQKQEVLITSGGEVLCKDRLSGRYFESSIEVIRKAQNDINAEIINNMYASQNEFYNKIGLPPIDLGDELGWRTDHLMDISFSTTMSEDNRPCMVLDYASFPVAFYYKAN